MKINILKNPVISIDETHNAKSVPANIHQTGSAASTNGIVLSLSRGENISSIKIHKRIFI
jgi:hypothetical protein